MTDEVSEEYFLWMVSHVYDVNDHMYMKLLRHLYSKEFYWTMEMDENRAGDGKDLRNQFEAETGIDMSPYCDIPCSVLEMLVALAIRCETHIMQDVNYGDRTSRWFWTMISNLGLTFMTDRHYDKEEVDDILDDFMLHSYSRNGKGGLFVTKNQQVDMRDLEIWKQMQVCMNDIFYNERG